MRKKIIIKSMLAAAMAMSMLCSAVGTTTAHAAGLEKVYFKISKDKICTEYSNGLPASLDQKSLAGKTVIISTNDIHGALLEFTYVSQLRNNLEDRDANVIIVDSGDFSTDKEVEGGYALKTKMLGTPSTKTEGIAPVKIMNAVGYDLICLGNHEFEKKKTSIDDIIKEANFKIVDSNVTKNTYKDKIEPNIVLDKNEKIGFFGLDSLENNNWYDDLDFDYSHNAEDLHSEAQKQVNTLRNDKKVDVVIGLTHLGVDNEPGSRAAKDPKKVTKKEALKPDRPDEELNKYELIYKNGIRSVDLFFDVTGIDLLLDAHSHTTFTGCEDFPDFNIQSNGIQFQNIGVVVIGEKEGKQAIEDRFLIPEKYYDKIGEDKKISGYIGYVLDTLKDIDDGEKISASEARKEIENYDPEKDYSEYYMPIDKDAYSRIEEARNSSNKSSKDSKRDEISAAEDSASIEASLPENEIEAAEAASSSSIENEDAANSDPSEDAMNAEASSEEISSDEATSEQSEDENTGKTGRHHRERHHHRGSRQGFGG